MVRPKRFELPFSGIGIRCVIQLRHGRMTTLLYTFRDDISRGILKKQQHEVDGMIKIDDKIEYQRERNKAVGDPPLAHIQQSDREKQRSDHNSGDDTFCEKSERQIIDDPAHQRISLVKYLGMKQDDGADPVRDVQGVNERQFFQ